MMMNKLLLFLSLMIILLGLTGCPLTSDTDDEPEVYTGGAVSGVVFEVLGPQSVRLTWSETFPDEQGFRIDRKEWDGSWTNNLLQVGANVTTAIDTTAELGKIYYYHIYAYKGNAESVKEQHQFNFDLPYPYNVDRDFSWANPTRIRLFWTNLAPWADSIVVAKRLNYGDWTATHAVLPATATEYTDTSYDVYTTTSWGFTAYYQDHVSQQATLTILPPKTK